MSKKISLRQFLMRAGIFERAGECVDVIRSGKAEINGKAISNPDYFFNPKKSLVTLEGRKIKKAEKLYFLFNKPSGYVCQKSSSEQSIYDVLKESSMEIRQARSLFAVGRLDKNTQGLMILTNDGDISQRISSPENKIEKEFLAVLEQPLAKIFGI